MVGEILKFELSSGGHNEVDWEPRANGMARAQVARTEGMGVAHVSCTQGLEVVLEPISERKSGHHRKLAGTLRTPLLADGTSSSEANADTSCGETTGRSRNPHAYSLSHLYALPNLYSTASTYSNAGVY